MYSKGFDYKLELDEALDPEFAKYINSLISVPRIKLNNDKIRKRFEKEFILKHSYYGDLGYQGEFFSGPPICEVQDDPAECDKPDNQPDAFCHWIIEDDYRTLKFDDDYFEFFGIYYRPDIDPLWIKYLILNFFEPNGYFLNGWIEDEKNMWIISKNFIQHRSKS